MLVSSKKSMFLHNCPEADICEFIRGMFPYQMEKLDLGLKYLGYYLKLNRYKVEDWN